MNLLLHLLIFLDNFHDISWAILLLLLQSLVLFEDIFVFLVQLHALVLLCGQLLIQIWLLHHEFGFEFSELIELIFHLLISYISSLSFSYWASMATREWLSKRLTDNGSANLLALGVGHKIRINIYHGIVISMKWLLGYLMLLFQLGPSYDELIQHCVVVVVQFPKRVPLDLKSVFQLLLVVGNDNLILANSCPKRTTHYFCYLYY